MQQFRIPTTVWRRIVRHLPLHRPLLIGATALLLISPVATLLQYISANATLPLYAQESPGFGDRKIADGWYDEFAVDASGNVFVTGGGGNNGFIRKFAPDGTFIKDFYHPDLAIATQTLYGRMATDPNGNLFAIDEQVHNIHVYTNDGVFQRTITNVPTSTEIAFDSTGNYYLTDAANYRVIKYTNTGTQLYTIGGPAAGSADGKFNRPGNIAVDSQNNLIVTDTNNYRIQMFTSSGSFLRKFGQKTTGFLCPPQPSLDSMAGLAVDQNDNIYVATHAAWCNNNVQKFTTSGTYVETQSRPNSTSYLRSGPSGVIYELEYETYVSGAVGGYVIARYDASGTVLTQRLVGGVDKLKNPIATAQDSAGNTYVADAANHRVQKFDSSHTLVQNIGSYGTGNGQFRNVSGLTIDQNNILYVGDTYRSDVQKFTTTGTYLGKFGSSGSGDGQFQTMGKMDVRPDGTIAVLDGRLFSGSRIQFFQPDGTIAGKIALDATVSFAIKSDGTVSVYQRLSSYYYSTYQIYTYSTANVQIGSPVSVRFYDAATNSSFSPYADIAYDKNDNLYTLGNDSRNPQNVNTVARLNLTNPDLPGYEVIIPTVYDLDARLTFTATNQMLVTSGVNNYVFQYDTTGSLNAPNAPITLTSSPARGSVSLTWQPASGPLASKYLVEYRPHGQMQWLRHEATTATSSTIDGLLADDYDVRVRAMNQAGLSIVTEKDDISVTADYRYQQLLPIPNDGAIRGIGFAPDGRRYDVDGWNDVINMYDADGTFLKSFGSSGSDPGQLSNARQPAVANNKLYVPDSSNQRVNIYDLDGNFLSSFGGTYGGGDGEMMYPSQVFANTDGTIYVVSEYNNIQHYSADGIFIERAFTDLPEPVSMTRDTAGNYYVSVYPEDDGAVIYKYNSTGTELLRFGTYGSGIGQTYEAPGLAVNTLDQLIVNDAYNERIAIYDTATGAFLTNIGRGYGDQGEYLTFDDPYTIAQAPNGDLYIPNSYSSFTQVLRPTFSATGGTPSATAPSSPQAISASSPSAGTLLTTWQPPTSDGGQPLTGYLLEYKPTSGNSWSQLALPANATTHSLTGVPAGSYDVRVSATNSVGTSLPGVIATITVSAAAAPADPAPNPSPSPTPPPSPTPTTVLPVVAVTTTPTSTYVAPPTLPSTPTGKSSQDNTPVIQPSANSSSAVQVATRPGHPSTPTIAWQPPSGSTPDHYVIEYRNSTVPDSDTTVPWRQASRVPGSKTSATITLPTGNYTIRVAAILPGESPRIIVGIAHITIPAANEPATIEPAVSWTWVSICIGLVMVAVFILIPVIWKRRRKQQQAEAERRAQLPPRWQ